MLDRQGRTIDYLRVSVTDQCNYRCVYCMPAGGVASIAHDDVLTFEEILRLVRLAAGLGVRVCLHPRFDTRYPFITVGSQVFRLVPIVIFMETIRYQKNAQRNQAVLQ